jgi:hypothetical protein
MQANSSAGPGNRPTRAKRRRPPDPDYLELLERLERRRADADAFLEAQLEPGEAMLARSGGHPLVTDRRIVWARQLEYPPRTGEWVCDSISFSQITAWALGRRHDGRPLVRLEHAPVQRIERVPAHHFLRFEWGNVEAPVTRDTTLFGFSRASNPVLIALIRSLEQASVTQGEPFVVRPAGTREERMGGSGRRLYRQIPPWRRIRFRPGSFTDRLLRGRPR